MKYFRYFKLLEKSYKNQLKTVVTFLKGVDKAATLFYSCFNSLLNNSKLFMSNLNIFIFVPYAFKLI